MPEITRNMLTWPPHKVGTGAALGKNEVCARLGLSRNTLDARIARTQQGKPTAGVPFPVESGWAFPPNGDDLTETPRLQPVPYWYERVVIAYGKQVGDLDDKGQIVTRAEPAA